MREGVAKEMKTTILRVCNVVDVKRMTILPQHDKREHAHTLAELSATTTCIPHCKPVACFCIQLAFIRASANMIGTLVLLYFIERSSRQGPSADHTFASRACSYIMLCYPVRAFVLHGGRSCCVLFHPRCTGVAMVSLCWYFVATRNPSPIKKLYINQIPFE